MQIPFVTKRAKPPRLEPLKSWPDMPPLQLLRFGLLAVLFGTVWCFLPNAGELLPFFAKVLIGLLWGGVLVCCALVIWLLPVRLVVRWSAVAYFLSLFTILPWMIMPQMFGLEKNTWFQSCGVWLCALTGVAIFVGAAEGLSRAVVRFLHWS